MVTKNDVSSLVNLFFEAGALRKTLREHYRRLLTHDFSDNIASHSFRTALIAWFLAKLEGVDPYRAAMMGLLHDFPEARTGDADWVERAYRVEEEVRAEQYQFGTVLFGGELLELLLEYQAKESVAAQIVDDADHLDQLLLQMEYAHQGNREAKMWLHLEDFEGKNNIYLRLHTESARVLSLEIIAQTPSDWWQNIWQADKS